MWKVVFCCLALLGVQAADPQAAQADSSAFTYQGLLQDGGTPASGSYDLQFRLFDALASGAQVGSTEMLEDVPVFAGIFTVALDFGTDAFPGADRFLEVAVRPGASSGTFTTLAPRQPVTAAPWALNAARLNGLAAGEYVLTNDARLSDARMPTTGSPDYIQNSTDPQPDSNFSISGDGVVGGNLTVGGAINGSGANLVNLNAGNITAGMLDNARITVPFIVQGSPTETSAIVTGRNYADYGVGVFGDAHGYQAYGVWGVAQGQGYGVQGESTDGVGVRGNSTNSTAILGFSQNGSTGVFGGTAAAAGAAYGVYGTTQSSSGSGVQGQASSASGSTYGVRGVSQSSSGTGVRGEAYSDTGMTHGVDGESTSTSGTGVRGYASSATGGTVGVLGLNLSSSGIGVRGVADSLTGATQGVYGLTKSSSGVGVQGFASNAIGTTYGVNGQSVSGSGVGVGGYASSASGATFGVTGESFSTSGTGVRGWATSGSGLTYGVYGQSFSSGGVGVFGHGSTGVRGETQSTTGFGIAGVNNGAGASVSWGVYGQNTSTGGYGVEGYNPNGIGVRGNGGLYAGQFVGNVQVLGTLSKSAGSFQIDHPLDPANSYLFHSFVESPDMKNIYDGVVELDSMGEAWVELPDYFEALNRDFRYQLTALGSAAPYLHVADPVTGNRFRIAGGSPGQQVSWQVTGIRQDAYAAAHPIEVEVPKEPGERGKYLYPALYDQPQAKAVVQPSAPLQASANRRQ